MGRITCRGATVHRLRKIAGVIARDQAGQGSPGSDRSTSRLVRQQTDSHGPEPVKSRLTYTVGHVAT